MLCYKILCYPSGKRFTTIFHGQTGCEETFCSAHYFNLALLIFDTVEQKSVNYLVRNYGNHKHSLSIPDNA